MAQTTVVRRLEDGRSLVVLQRPSLVAGEVAQLSKCLPYKPKALNPRARVKKVGKVVHTCNPSTEDGETGIPTAC